MESELPLDLFVGASDFSRNRFHFRVRCSNRKASTRGEADGYCRASAKVSERQLPQGPEEGFDSISQPDDRSRLSTPTRRARLASPMTDAARHPRPASGP